MAESITAARGLHEIAESRLQSRLLLDASTQSSTGQCRRQSTRAVSRVTTDGLSAVKRWHEMITPYTRLVFGYSFIDHCTCAGRVREKYLFIYLFITKIVHEVHKSN